MRYKYIHKTVQNLTNFSVVTHFHLCFFKLLCDQCQMHGISNLGGILKHVLMSLIIFNAFCVACLSIKT